MMAPASAASAWPAACAGQAPASPSTSGTYRWPAAAIGDHETQLRDYGVAAVKASREADAEMGARRSSVMFWLYRRLARGRNRGC